MKKSRNSVDKIVEEVGKLLGFKIEKDEIELKSFCSGLNNSKKIFNKIKESGNISYLKCCKNDNKCIRKVLQLLKEDMVDKEKRKELNKIIDSIPTINDPSI